MRRSLRLRLQLWHALILLAVIAGFGSLLYVQSRRAKLDEIDAELLASARVLEGVLRAFPGPGRGLGPRGDRDGRRPPPPFRGRGDGPVQGDERPPPPPFGPPPRRPPGGMGLAGLRLPSSILARYAEPGREPYFAVWMPGGEILHAEPNPPDAPIDPSVGPNQESHVRQRGPRRELTLMGPGRTRILVGRPIGRELAELDRLGIRLILSGLGVLSVGLAGGWWLSTRAVRPIRAMSGTLAGITASKLSNRLNLRQADSELEDLGAIVNQMLERLEHAFDQQVRFTADASHELRTPLAVILTHTELALARPRNAAEYREALNTCARAATRMKSLVDDLLLLARADAGRLELKRAAVDLAVIARDSVHLLAALATQKDVRLILTGESVEVDGDPDRLARLATNLIANAIQYNAPGGTVTVTTGAAGGQAVLDVADTGVGLTTVEIPLLFERFYRVDAARSRDSGGSGLGLAICKSIIEAHGGTITVASELGKGSTFTARLPRRPNPGARSAVG